MSDEPEPPESESEPESTQIDPAQVAYIRQRLESEQNLVLGATLDAGSQLSDGLWLITLGFVLGLEPDLSHRWSRSCLLARPAA